MSDNVTNTTGRLAGKMALVTGSTRGLGRTTAEWLAREGCGVVVTGRDQADVNASVAAVSASGVTSFGITADLSRVDEAHRLANEMFGRVDQLDILVNNAGMSIRDNFWDVTDEEWDIQTNVNYRSPFILAQYAARHMIEKQIRGRIVNFSTIGASYCHKDALVYDAAKGAVEVMTRNMAFELGPYGITVNCVAPGAVAERPGVSENREGWDQYARNIPSGRVGKADDIANLILFYCLPESEWISGQTILVDGAHATYLNERVGNVHPNYEQG